MNANLLVVEAKVPQACVHVFAENPGNDVVAVLNDALDAADAPIGSDASVPKAVKKNPSVFVPEFEIPNKV